LDIGVKTGKIASGRLAVELWS